MSATCRSQFWGKLRWRAMGAGIALLSHGSQTGRRTKEPDEFAVSAWILVMGDSSWLAGAAWYMIGRASSFALKDRQRVSSTATRSCKAATSSAVPSAALLSPALGRNSGRALGSPMRSPSSASSASPSPGRGMRSNKGCKELSVGAAEAAHFAGVGAEVSTTVATSTSSRSGLRRSASSSCSNKRCLNAWMSWRLFSRVSFDATASS
mmetsp:Transcript_39566/g.109005  ORF Transcript_39566/g.109005 Transcript_39566/m.109005 type:complete len:208 (+) Transcript_39566:232-855(+)